MTGRCFFFYVRKAVFVAFNFNVEFLYFVYLLLNFDISVFHWLKQHIASVIFLRCNSLNFYFLFKFSTYILFIHYSFKMQFIMLLGDWFFSLVYNAYISVVLLCVCICLFSVIVVNLCVHRHLSDFFFYIYNRCIFSTSTCALVMWCFYFCIHVLVYELDLKE